MGWNCKGMYWYEYGMDVYQQRLLFTCATYCLALLIEGLINMSCDDKKVNRWLDSNSVTKNDSKVFGINKRNQASIEQTLIIERSGVEWSV